MARILIIDDDAAFRAGLAETLGDLGHEPFEAPGGQQGLMEAARGGWEAVFLDYRMADLDGLEVLRRMRAIPAAAETPVIMLTAYASGANTIQAMKLGAFEHLSKPVGRADIKALLDRILSVAPADDSANTGESETLIGSSREMREVQKLIGRAAAGDATVLVTGETGTGKELVARILHESSARARGPFVAVNCAAIPGDLLESTLFGHAKGAFTGAVAARPGSFREAQGGTLFLDEIGDMAVEMQAKILRVLEDRAVTPVGAGGTIRLDVRIVAATHRDLGAASRDGRFREDLYYRLNVVPIHLPPLRDRPADIPVLAAHFLSRATPPARKRLSASALARLVEHGWPGNVRELRNAMERVTALARGAVVQAEDLAFLGEQPLAQAGVLPAAVEALERSLIARTLAECGGNRTETARKLGIHRPLLYKKIKLYGLE